MVLQVQLPSPSRAGQVAAVGVHLGLQLLARPAQPLLGRLVLACLGQQVLRRQVRPQRLLQYSAPGSVSDEYSGIKYPVRFAGKPTLPTRLPSRNLYAPCLRFPILHDSVRTVILFPFF